MDGIRKNFHENIIFITRTLQRYIFYVANIIHFNIYQVVSDDEWGKLRY